MQTQFCSEGVVVLSVSFFEEDSERDGRLPLNSEILPKAIRSSFF